MGQILNEIKKLKSDGKIHPPKYLFSNTHYLCIMGSYAYGVSTDVSDVDLYGFCVPPKHILFPHTQGIIYGFDNQYEKFDQFTAHHIKGEGREYDLSVYNIVKYFRLCADNNPNMIDSLFVPIHCIAHTTELANHVRENRRSFLHKGIYHKLKGYAFSQLSKIDSKRNRSNPKRQKSIQEFGMDVKFAYHIVRLINQAEQVLQEGDLDLQKSKEQLKAVRAGEYSLDNIRNYFKQKEPHLEELYQKSKALPYKPDESKIKQLLLNCLEMHYGSLEKSAVQVQSETEGFVSELRHLINRHPRLF